MSQGPTRWIILDRDGVINIDSPDHILSPDAWKPIPGSLGAIAELTQRGYGIIVITNQSAIGRGLMTGHDLAAIHERMHEWIERAGGRLEAVYHCPHAPWENCACRKPNTALFHQFSKQFAVPLARLPAVGDARRDLEAAIAVGAQPVLVLTGQGRRTKMDLERHPLSHPVEIHADLAAFVRVLLGNAMRTGPLPES
jgi:D-glycero-D-manno-heptose 1,7-bisphosphate phosphatase